jgi:hypothetical protein
MRPWACQPVDAVRRHRRDGCLSDANRAKQCQGGVRWLHTTEGARAETGLAPRLGPRPFGHASRAARRSAGSRNGFRRTTWHLALTSGQPGEPQGSALNPAILVGCDYNRCGPRCRRSARTHAQCILNASRIVSCKPQPVTPLTWPKAQKRSWFRPRVCAEWRYALRDGTRSAVRLQVANILTGH